MSWGFQPKMVSDKSWKWVGMHSECSSEKSKKDRIGVGGNAWCKEQAGFLDKKTLHRFWAEGELERASLHYD